MTSHTLATTALWNPKHAELFAAMPPAFRELISTAKGHQMALGLPDAKFTGSILSGPAWNQLSNGNYPMPSQARGAANLEKNLRALVQRGEQLLMDSTAPTSAPLELIERPELARVEDALKEARRRLARDIEERLITVVGPTRSGKTCLIKLLTARQKVDWTFRARPSAKRSYRKFLEGLAKAVSVRDIEGKDSDGLEEAILAKLNVTACTLAIEELQRFSRAALEFLKSLLNDTQATIVLFIKHQEWKTMKRSKNEDMQQFLGRNIATIHLHITPAMVESLAAKAWPHGGDATQYPIIAQEGEKGGGMSAVRCILENSARLAKQRPVAAAQVKAALTVYRLGVPDLTPTAAKFLGSQNPKLAA